jgi:hypothetical protein
MKLYRRQQEAIVRGVYQSSEYIYDDLATAESEFKKATNREEYKEMDVTVYLHECEFCDHLLTNSRTLKVHTCKK